MKLNYLISRGFFLAWTFLNFLDHCELIADQFTHEKGKISYAKFDFQRIRRKKKEPFGKIIQNYLKTSLGRNFKFLRRVNRQLFDEEKPLVTQNTPYITSTEKLKFSNIYHIA